MGGITLAASISIATFLLGIMYKLVDISVKFGRFANTLEENENRDDEERRKNAAKFTELFNSRNRHESTLIRLDTTVVNMSTKLDRMDIKLDKIMDRCGAKVKE